MSKWNLNSHPEFFWRGRYLLNWRWELNAKHCFESNIYIKSVTFPLAQPLCNFFYSFSFLLMSSSLTTDIAVSFSMVGWLSCYLQHDDRDERDFGRGGLRSGWRGGPRGGWRINNRYTPGYRGGHYGGRNRRDDRNNRDYSKLQIIPLSCREPIGKDP